MILKRVKTKQCNSRTFTVIEIMMEDKGDALAAFAEFIREVEKVENCNIRSS